ncbi:MAG TPA: hypothetical protein VG329_09170 [Candidatus Dormibacteraeota bacterium]|nr:hypothetical protein [Candidatus Dormibacteraeota bacterium]
MPEIILTFMDGEVLTANAPLIDFHSPILRLTAVEPGDNNRDFIAPLSSVKYLIFGGEEEEPEPPDEPLGKVVIHFVDHEVIRAYAGRDTLGGHYGIIYSLVDQERRVRRRIGVPYTSVKAIFRVKRWDSRGKTPGKTFARVAKILAERERGDAAAAQPRRTPILERAARKRP